MGWFTKGKAPDEGGADKAVLNVGVVKGRVIEATSTSPANSAQRDNVGKAKA